MAEVYLTEEEAVRLMFPKSERISKRNCYELPMDRKSVIEERIGWKFPEESFDVYIGETGDADRWLCLRAKYNRQTQAHDLYGRSGRAGHVSNVELLVFREARGSEVRTKRFNVQYEGKTVLGPSQAQ